MNLLVAITLGLTAFATATLSGMIGMGGGALLLAVLSSFLDFSETIPAHAAVQITSNSTRVVAFWKRVDWPTMRRFVIGVVPAAVISGVILWLLRPGRATDPYLKGAIGVYILLFLILPKPRARESARGGSWEFTAIGLAAGVLGIFVGAVGPLIAPMFARHSFVKERLIATKAVAQATLHLIKLPIFFIVGGFEITRFTTIVVVMLLATIPGTLLGKWLLRFVSDQSFTTIYRVALAIAGTKLIVWDCAVTLLR